MFSRPIVFRCARTIRSAMKAAIAAVSLPPCSMSWSAAVRIFSRGFAGLVAAVPFGDPGIQVPAVVVEPRRLGDGADVGQVLLLELAEADDDVGDLDAGVVDVVLDLDRPPLEAQQPPEGVAGRGIPQVPDVGRLVRIDRRVLDDGLLVRTLSRASAFRRKTQPRLRPVRPIEEEIQVAVRRGFDARDPFERPEGAGQLLGDGAGRLAQPAGEGERDRDGDVAERAARRRFERHFGDCRIVGGQAVETADGLGHAGANELMDGQNHKLFRDTIFGRFLIQFNPASGARVIMRRVDVLEQRSVVVRRERLRPQLVYAEIREEAGDRQLAALEARPGRGRRTRRRYTAQSGSRPRADRGTTASISWPVPLSVTRRWSSAAVTNGRSQARTSTRSWDASSSAV